MFTAAGYSLYDSDDCKYWKYLGWESPDQRWVTRHQTNHVIDTAQPVFGNVQLMLSQFNGMLRYSNGRYTLDVRRKAPDDSFFNTYSAKVIQEDELIGALSIDDGTSKRKLNAVSTNIIDPSLRFGGRGITFQNSTYIAEDRGIKKEGNFKAPGITNYFNARMAVKQQLDESRFGITAKFSIDSKGYLLHAGDLIKLNYSRFNWENKLFRVNSLNFGPSGIVQVVATEHNEEAFVTDYVEDVGNTNLLQGGGSQGQMAPATPAAPTAGTISTDIAGRVEMSWTNGSNFNPQRHKTQIARAPTNVTPNAEGTNVIILADTSQVTFTDSTAGDYSSGDITNYYWVRHSYSRGNGSGPAISHNRFTAWTALGQGIAKQTTVVEMEGGIEIGDGRITFPDTPSGDPAFKAG